MLYEVLLPWATGSDLQLAQRATPDDLNGEFATPQRSGMCFFKVRVRRTLEAWGGGLLRINSSSCYLMPCATDPIYVPSQCVVCALKYLLRRYGVAKPKCKQLTFRIRYWYLRRMLAEVQDLPAGALGVCCAIKSQVHATASDGCVHDVSFDEADCVSRSYRQQV